MDSAVYKYNNHLTEVDGYMYCEQIRVKDIQRGLAQQLDQPSPFFLYSKALILENINAYKNALEKCRSKYVLGFSMKANHNPTLLRIYRSNGLTAVAVNGNELTLAIQQGFDPEKIVMNGNGKQKWEIALAVTSNCLINVDSDFDLKHISSEARKLKTAARILLRLNPDIDSNIHPFLATGLAASKFGIEEQFVSSRLLESIRNDPHVNLVGLHCHLGSTIDNTNVFRECAEVMLRVTKDLNELGFDLKFLNLGGGLGVSYTAHAWRTQDSPERSIQTTFPTPSDLIEDVQDILEESGLCLILEPGRSLIAQAVTLVTKVIGCKTNGDKNYVVVDGSMNEVIRPSLYGAYHHIELTEPSQLSGAARHKCDIVGPVCECADFLGKARWLTKPHEECGLAVLDTGAYCASMSSNYNLRMRAVEVLVDGSTWRIIRYPDKLDDLMEAYPDTREPHEPQAKMQSAAETHE